MRILQVLSLGAVLFCSMAQAAQISHDFNIPASGTPAVVDFTNTTTVPLFDPTLGMLTRITIDLTGIISGSQLIDNENDFAVDNGTATTSIQMDLKTASLGSLTAVNPVAAFFFSVGADSDSFPDFSGADSASNTFSDVTDSATVVISDVAALAAFSGPGDITLALQALGTFTIAPGGNIAGFTITRGIGRGTVTYTFDEAPNGQIPEPLTMLMIGSGLALLGLRRRRATA